MHRQDLMAPLGEQLMDIRHDDVVGREVAHGECLVRRSRDLGHRGAFECPLDGVEVIGRARCRHRALRAHCGFLQAAARRKQSHADLDQAEVAFDRHDAPRAVQHQLAAAAKRNARYGADDRHLGILDPHHRVLEQLDEGFNALGAALHHHGHGSFEIGTGREGTARRAELQ